MNKRNGFNKKVLGLITFGFIIVLSLCVNNKAKGADIQTVKLTGAGYQEAENQYIAQVREVLDTNGFCNSGINLDKATTEQGSIVYTLSIRHRRFDKIDADKKSELKENIEKLTLDVRFSKVSVIFIE